MKRETPQIAMRRLRKEWAISQLIAAAQKWQAGATQPNIRRLHEAIHLVRALSRKGQD